MSKFLANIYVILGCLVVVPALGQSSLDYLFPIKEPYAATVIGTPMALKTKLPRFIPSKVMRIDGLRDDLPYFWYERGLAFSAALQPNPAPLIFNIGGTGAAYNSSKMISLQKALYKAGYNVINLSSPTHFNFQLNASTSFIPGYIPDDINDLYRVMQKAQAMIKDDIQVTATHVTGYSLGAMHAVFIAELDSREKALNIDKVYMINPPVNLKTSVNLIDRMLEDNIEGGPDGVGPFLNEVVQRLAEAYKPEEGMQFDGDFVYNAYQQLPEEDRQSSRKEYNDAAALIGFSFRLTSGAMVTAADLMTHAGYIIPKNKVFKHSEPIKKYAYAAHRVNFNDYLNDIVIPYLQKKDPSQTAEKIIAAVDLRAIEEFLLTNENIGVVTNRNEIILTSDDMSYLQTTFADRLHIYPEGGHCGNIDHRVNVADMIAFFKGADAR